MIVIEKRRAARGAYWGLVVYCAISLTSRYLADLLERGGMRAPEPSQMVWLADARVQFAAILGAAIAGYYLPTKVGYPNEDSIGRALLLAPLLGVLFLALHYEYGFNLDFWSGLQFGFLAGALIPPRVDKKDKP